MSLVLQYSILNSFLSTLSLTKKYLIEMCLEFPVHEFLLFFSILIALILSWCNTLSFNLQPCASKKLVNNILNGIYSLLLSLLFPWSFSRLTFVSTLEHAPYPSQESWHRQCALSYSYVLHTMRQQMFGVSLSNQLR